MNTIHVYLFLAMKVKRVIMCRLAYLIIGIYLLNYYEKMSDAFESLGIS